MPGGWEDLPGTPDRAAEIIIKKQVHLLSLRVLVLQSAVLQVMLGLMPENLLNIPI